MTDDRHRDDLQETGLLSGEDLERLRAARGAQQPPTSLLIYNRDGVQVVPLRENRCVVIGRFPPADVAIRDGSLSRQHASIELLEGEVWVEDLDSTNGTRIDGEPVGRARLEVGAELELGAVRASLHRQGSGGGRGVELGGHDPFQRELEAEVVRARRFGRGLALLRIRSARTATGPLGGTPLGSWLGQIRNLLRSFDRVALYSHDTLEVLLPEADEASALGMARRMADGDEPLRIGVALMPRHASTAGKLVAVAGSALRAADGADPLVVAGPEIDGLPAPDAGPLRGPIIECDAMRRVFATARKVAGSAIPVLLTGETGTGKEVLARFIHESGDRAGKPLICVNCGGIPSNLVESTLFGHEKGAFTGADRQRRGLFETAHGGSILLDEVGELPAEAQAALLRVLETKRFNRVGSSREIEVDVRVIAATHRDLEAMCKDGQFRDDLRYRLNAMTLRIPSLRERPEEIRPLAELFIQEANAANHSHVTAVDPDAMERLTNHPWPGNVRELRNAIERAVVIAAGDTIVTDDLPDTLRGPDCAGPVTAEPDGDTPCSAALADEINLRSEVQRYEMELILRALDGADGDRNLAARRLGLPVRTLAHKLKKFGITRKNYDQQ